MCKADLLLSSSCEEKQQQQRIQEIMGGPTNLDSAKNPANLIIYSVFYYFCGRTSVVFMGRF